MFFIKSDFVNNAGLLSPQIWMSAQTSQVSVEWVNAPILLAAISASVLRGITLLLMDLDV